MGGVGVQALTHGTLPWTAEGHTRTTLFCQPPVTSHPCTPLVQTLTAVDIDAAAAGSADKYMPRHEAWSREEDYFDPALVSHYPDVRIPPPRQPSPADCGSQALLVSCAPSHGCSYLPLLCTRSFASPLVESDVVGVFSCVGDAEDPVDPEPAWGGVRAGETGGGGGDQVGG